jgi:hypothetical protein
LFVGEEELRDLDIPHSIDISSIVENMELDNQILLSDHEKSEQLHRNKKCRRGCQ